MLKRSLLLLSGLLVGCTFATVPQATPTVIPATATQGPTNTPVPTATLTDTPTAEVTVPLIEPTNTPEPPTHTPPPSPTPGPFEHTIRQGETLGFIVQQYGHRDPAVYSEVVRINETIFSADNLPGAGAVILIPRPTLPATPTPVVDEQGNVIDVPSAPSLAEQVADFTVIQHIVREGESILGISQQYRTTLEILSQLNPELFFGGCNFNLPTGGPDCSVLIREGDPLNVPAPTPTPTLSPTPNGNETATPTPTFPAPQVVSPPEGGVAPARAVRLQWVSTGMLAPDETYLVVVNDLTADTQFNDVTRSTSLQLPASMIPTGGQMHDIQWTVTVARLNENGRYETISGPSRVHSFRWQGS